MIIAEYNTNEKNLEIQIIKLTFLIVSYVAILNVTLQQGCLSLNIDIRSVLVFVITSWIDCLALSSETGNYYGNITKLKEQQYQRNVFGGVLGILLVPICFLLLFMGANNVNIEFWTELVMGAAAIFIGLKFETILEIIKYKKNNERS